MTQTLNWHRLENSTQLAQTAAEMILTAANNSILERGSFKLVLAGGNTPAQAYALLINAVTDWQKWHIYYGDERCLAVEDKNRNSVMATEAFLQHVPIPSTQIHPMPTELGAELSAKKYCELISTALPFDLVLLGMGEDGHTASLFPDQQHKLDELVHPVANAPKPPADRISLSAQVLSQAQQVIFLISAGKDEALTAWKQGAELPIAQIQPQAPIEVLLALN